MSIAVIIGVHDGVVLAADSASTLAVAAAPGVQGVNVLNVYENANKIFNLHKGRPLGCITYGSGSIGNASIATLMKDLREKLRKKELGFDPDNYTIKGVADILTAFLDSECAKVTDPVVVNGISMGFLLGGYSSKEPLAESWSLEINQGKTTGITELRKKEDAGLSWGGQGELLSRVALGYSPGIFQVLADATGNPKGPASAAYLQQTIGPLLIANLQAPLVFAPMPIQDAIDLAHFLVDATIQFSRFLSGPQVVGGPIEIAAITKHEGFKWISRKYYYDQELNNEVPYVT
jgi:hypothetical protein